MTDKPIFDYTDFYKTSDYNWRMTGARQKAKNILDLTGSVPSPIKKTIEVGAGDGSILSWLSQTHFSEEYYALEISESAIEKLSSRKIDKIKEIKHFDGYTIPYADKEFDVAICSHVIEHVDHPRILLSEIKRISKFQVFEVPIDYSHKVHKKYKHFISYGHINIYSPSTFLFLLKTVDFEIVKILRRMYSLKSIWMSSKQKPMSFAINVTKLIIWNTLPILRKRKPHTVTVLTKSE